MAIKYLNICILLGLAIVSCKNKSITPQDELVQIEKRETTNVHSLNSSDYNEPHRNQFHFSPPANWMNDPNGMVYADGVYHLFYQYYPDSTVWGPMHWGHAVSSDMMHWEHLPIALYPDSLGYIFSGSCVIDKDNTAGFGKDAMIAIFTYHDIVGERSGTSNTFQYQAIAYSTDDGRTFTKYNGNPVIPNPGIKDFRDPKVTWDEDSQQWLMVFAAHDHVKLYGSTNLKEWTHLSDWGKEYGAHTGVWECPDLVKMKVARGEGSKWVLIQSLNPGAPNGGSGTQYFVGDFDGKEFKLDPDFKNDVTDGKAVWLDFGTDNYAGVTWSNTADRTLFIGWMSNWQYAQVVPTEKWRSAMTLPRELYLYQEPNGYRLRTLPVKEIANIDGETKRVVASPNVSDIIISQNAGPKRIDLVFENIASSMFQIRFSNAKSESIEVTYDNDAKTYTINRSNAGNVSFEDNFGIKHTAPIDYDTDEVRMSIYLDEASIELFADQGRTVMTDIHFTTEPFNKVELIRLKGKANMTSGKVTELKSVW